MNNMSKKTIIKLVIASVLLLTIIVVITIFSLRLWKSDIVTNNTTANVATGPSSAEIIKEYTTSNKIGDRDSEYERKIHNSKSVPLSYKLNNKLYEVQVNPVDYVEYYKKGSNSKSVSKSINTATETFLTEKGLKKGSTRDLGDLSYVTYDSDGVVCQLITYVGDEPTIAPYGLNCTDMKKITEEYSNVESLMTIYKKTNKLDELVSISSNTVSEGNKKLSKLDVVTKKSDPISYILIFASIDDKWSYIGKRQTPQIDSKESFRLSPELNKAINNPKYNGFLKKYIN